MEHYLVKWLYFVQRRTSIFLQIEDSHLLGCHIESKCHFGLIVLQCLTLKIKTLPPPETSGPTYPVTQHDIPEGYDDSDLIYVKIMHSEMLTMCQSVFDPTNCTININHLSLVSILHVSTSARLSSEGIQRGLHVKRCTCVRHIVVRNTVYQL
jgi:hypothetical protein